MNYKGLPSNSHMFSHHKETTTLIDMFLCQHNFEMLVRGTQDEFVIFATSEFTDSAISSEKWRK
jgi:hypothetical protein